MEKTKEKGFWTDLIYQVTGIRLGESPETAPNRKALVVGFEHYGQKTEFQATPHGMVPVTQNRSLPSDVHDAHVVAGKLAKNAKGDNFKVRCIVDEPANEEEHADFICCERAENESWLDLFDRELDELFKDSTPKDTLLLYYSGHGTYDAKTKELLFALPDKGDDGSVLYYEMGRLLQRIEAHSFLHCVLLLDCCYAGGIADIEASPSFCRLKKGVTIITAGQEGITVGATGIPVQIGKTKKSWQLSGNNFDDFPEYKAEKGFHGTGIQVNYSCFTGFLVEALAGGAADPMGVITTTSLYQYISEGMWILEKSEKTDRLKITRPVMKSYTDEAVPLKIVDCYLNGTDLQNMYKKFVLGVKFKDVAELEKDALARELILLEKDVKDHEKIQRSVNKLLRLQLAEGGSIVQTNGQRIKFYRLTARGKHYRDMVSHLYEIDAEATREAEPVKE